MSSTYNGWRNHSTWAVGLWLMDHVINEIVDDLDNWAEADVEQAADLFSYLVDEQIKLADLSAHGLLLDLLDVSDIDWQALGAHALEAAGLPALAVA